MLDLFSWRDFLIATVAMTLVWYGLVVLVFYRGWLAGLFGGDGLGSLSGGPPRGGGLPVRENSGDAGLEVAASGGTDEDELMGKRRLPEGMSEVEAGTMAFAGGEQVNKLTMLGLVADVVEEVKEVLAMLESGGGGKREFLALMREVALRYPGIGGFPSLAHINSFILEKVGFELTVAELDGIWNEA